jgi:DNA-binding CsgD family transcriptional regulator
MILGISERTVKFHVANFLQKLDAVTRPQAVAIALEQGLVEIE